MSNIKITGYNSDKTEKIGEVKFSSNSELFDYLDYLLREIPITCTYIKKVVSNEQFPIGFRVSNTKYDMTHAFVYIIDRDE